VGVVTAGRQVAIAVWDQKKAARLLGGWPLMTGEKTRKLSAEQKRVLDEIMPTVEG